MASCQTLAEFPPDMPWLVVEVKNQQFGIPCRHVKEMLQLPEVAAIPETAPYVRGVFNLRGRVLPVIDLRVRIGIPAVQQETDQFCQLMVQREQDHRNWLKELEASVREHRPFKLARDPHLCAFGKWYDAYKPSNVWIANLLKRFEVPHGQIHALADQVDQLLAENQFDQAADIQAAGNGVLAKMVGLFGDLRTLMCEVQREIAVVLTVGERSFAISADCAISVDKLTAGSIQPLPAAAATGHNGVVQRLGRRVRHAEPLMLIEADRILDSSLAVAA